MAFRTNSLGEDLRTIRQQFTALKRNAQTTVATLQAGDVEAEYILGIRGFANNIKARTQSLVSAALVDYARNEVNDPAYDIVAEYNAVIAAIDAIDTNIENTFPTGAGGYLLERQFTADGYAQRTFTPAETATLAGLITALIATIE